MGVREVLLGRRGLVFVPRVSSDLSRPSDEQVTALELELAALGYVVSYRLRAELAATSLDELTELRRWMIQTLLESVGGERKHEPLFRRFPHDVPADTHELWWKRVLVFYLQTDGEPCLFCRQVGTTHVLDPCRHVVCDRCFDGSSYSACPVCQHHVDRGSPFFRPAPAAAAATRTSGPFRLLDRGEDEDTETRALFVALCRRTQALSPDDRDALLAVVRERKAEVLGWLPSTIPVRENVAAIFGTLFELCPNDAVVPQAKRFMTTATDVLRFIAVLSGTDGSLVPVTVVRPVRQARQARPAGQPDVPKEPTAPPFWTKVAKLFGAEPPSEQKPPAAMIRVTVRRFKTARLPRPLRRALLQVLEALDPDTLVEDMFRHRSWWVWVGEFLHPGEYRRRFPNVARAFDAVRNGAPFERWATKVEYAAEEENARAMLELLAHRPGELARRLDHTLRLAMHDTMRAQITATFASKASLLATPVLLTLRSHMSTRGQKASHRVYWPKTAVALGVVAPDRRPVLPPSVTGPIGSVIDDELLRRFARAPSFPIALVDDALRHIVVPFNERTASRSAVALPRGSRAPVPRGKLVRLFLHWCQPQAGGRETDLDLSVAFYDSDWNYAGTCSYYQLRKSTRSGEVMAESAGDLQDAPWPAGATELVDLHWERALSDGVRYAVMVVNAYRGMPFSKLAHAFAGVMLRDDAKGPHFDPRAATLKFALDGENGTYLPLVFDLREDLLHWLDVHARGQFEENNVETSRRAIVKICPTLIEYFQSGVRPSMRDLALLHAAARAPRVLLRGSRPDAIAEMIKRPGETPRDFLARLRAGAEAADAHHEALPPLASPALALLYRGDVDLPDGSSAYALFRERVTPALAASDLVV
jgi:hypothetical protein